MAVVGDNGGAVTWSSNYLGLTGIGTSFDTGVLTNSGTALYTLNITATAVTGICQDKVVGTSNRVARTADYCVTKIDNSLLVRGAPKRNPFVGYCWYKNKLVNYRQY